MHSSGDDSSESQDPDYHFRNGFLGNIDENPYGTDHNNGREHRSIINSAADVKYSSWFFHSPLFLQWTPVHHFYYQLSQLCILLLLVMNLNKKQRFLIVLYSVFHCLWGWFVMKSMDIFVWGVLITVFNIFSAVWTLCSEWPLRFRAENEMVCPKNGLVPYLYFHLFLFVIWCEVVLFKDSWMLCFLM